MQYTKRETAALDARIRQMALPPVQGGWLWDFMKESFWWETRGVPTDVRIPFVANLIRENDRLKQRLKRLSRQRQRQVGQRPSQTSPQRPRS